MNDSAEPSAPEDFDDHIDYLTGLVIEAAPEDDGLRERIFNAVEELVRNVDGGPWAGCAVAWTGDIPDSPADWTEGEQ